VASTLSIASSATRAADHELARATVTPARPWRADDVGADLHFEVGGGDEQSCVFCSSRRWRSIGSGCRRSNDAETAWQRFGATYHPGICFSCIGFSLGTNNRSAFLRRNPQTANAVSELDAGKTLWIITVAAVDILWPLSARFRKRPFNPQIHRRKSPEIPADSGFNSVALATGS